MMDGALSIILVILGVYVLIGCAIALAAYVDARRVSTATQWHAGLWVTAVGLGPLLIVMLLLQRVIPDPEEPRPDELL